MYCMLLMVLFACLPPSLHLFQVKRINLVFVRCSPKKAGKHGAAEAQLISLQQQTLTAVNALIDV